MKYPKFKIEIKKVFLAISFVFVVIFFTIFFIKQLLDDTAYIIEYSYYLDHESAIENEGIEKFKFNKKEWEEKIISDEEAKYNLEDSNIWKVSLENDKIMVSTIPTQNFEVNPSQQYRLNPLRFDMDDGYFISKHDEDYEDIGGKIDFIGNDGLVYTVSKYVTPLAIFSINDSIFLLDGMSYRSSDRGNLYKLSKSDGKWGIKKGINDVYLDGYPYQYMIDKSDIYIIVYNRIYDNYHNFINSSKIIKISIEDDEMDMQEIIKIVFLPATSMAKKGNMLYIGIEGSVAIVDLKNNEIKFYTKK